MRALDHHAGNTADMRRRNAPLANDFTLVYESPRPQDVYCYTPGIARSPSGRLITTFDLGGDGVAALSGPKGARAAGTRFGMGMVSLSDDGGNSWRQVHVFPFWHARPFFANGRLYILGHAGDVMIISSDDDGETWNVPVALTSGQKWHGSACNVLVDRGRVHLALDQRKDLAIEGWNVAGLAPRVLRAPLDRDLCDTEQWQFSEAPAFNEVVTPEDLDWLGFPVYATPARRPAILGPDRICAPMGWLEPNLVKVSDPTHVWHDPSGRTLHLILRTNTGGTGYGALLKVVEQRDGSLKTELQRAPSGKRLVFVPLPGGHLKFHILADPKTNLYWLVSSQATDSMTQLTHLPRMRYNLANNERHRLQLHFSTNCIDWCFAGMVAVGPSERHARNYPSMTIADDDLLILCRSGDERALDPQYTNMITFHRIRNFRELAY